MTEVYRYFIAYYSVSKSGKMRRFRMESPFFFHLEHCRNDLRATLENLDIHYKVSSFHIDSLFVDPEDPYISFGDTALPF